MFLLFYSLFFTKYLYLCTYKKLHNVTSPWLATSKYLWTLKPVQHNIRTNAHRLHKVSLQSRGFVSSVMWSSVAWVAPDCNPRVLQRIGNYSPNNRASCPRRPETSATPLWEPQIAHTFRVCQPLWPLRPTNKFQVNYVLEIYNLYTNLVQNMSCIGGASTVTMMWATGFIGGEVTQLSFMMYSPSPRPNLPSFGGMSQEVKQQVPPKYL
jgi:hypothetical protein